MGVGAAVRNTHVARCTCDIAQLGRWLRYVICE